MIVNKIIDFHIHCFPDNLAEKALNNLSDRARKNPYTNCTLSVTKSILRKWDTDYAVSLNIAVSPKSVIKVNNFAINTNKDNIISFGSVNPYNDNWESELIRISEAGLKGIKLHPEYQDFDVNMDKAINIYRKCGQLGLIVLLHCGKDVSYPDTLRASPKAIYDALYKAYDTQFVLAHMGGHKCSEGVLKYLAKVPNAWFDTAYTARVLKKDIFKRIVDKCGTKKILYATDCPWESGILTQKYIYNMGYTKDELSDIMYNNAYNLLGGID